MTHSTNVGVRGIVRHVRTLWPGPGILLPLPFVGWALAWLAAGRGRLEHVLILLGVPLLAFLNERSKRLFVGALSQGLLGLVYDTTRLVRNLGVTPARVHLCDLRALDMRIASATVDGTRGTVHDWIQVHPWPALDLVCAVPYGTFLFVIIGFAVYLYAKDYARMRRFGWAFLILNLVASSRITSIRPPRLVLPRARLPRRPRRAAERGREPRARRRSAGHPLLSRLLRPRERDLRRGPIAPRRLSAAHPPLRLAGPEVARRVFACLFMLTMCTAAGGLDHHWIIDIVIGLATRSWSTRALRPTPVATDRRRGSLVKQRIAYVLATWFGCGRVPIAPGTAGTPRRDPALSVAAPERTGSGPCRSSRAHRGRGVAAGEVVLHTGKKDPQIVVIDEVVGVLITLASSARRGGASSWLRPLPHLRSMEAVARAFPRVASSRVGSRHG